MKSGHQGIHLCLQKHLISSGEEITTFLSIAEKAYTKEEWSSVKCWDPNDTTCVFLQTVCKSHSLEHLQTKQRTTT